MAWFVKKKEKKKYKNPKRKGSVLMTFQNI